MPQGHDLDEYQGEEPIPPSNSAVASGTGPLSTEGMTDDEKMHFEELGHQVRAHALARTHARTRAHTHARPEAPGGSRFKNRISSMMMLI